MSHVRSKLEQFGNKGVLKIFSQWMTHSLTHLNNYKAVFRIVPTTLVLFFKTIEQFLTLSRHLNTLCKTDDRTQICLASIDVSLWS